MQKEIASTPVLEWFFRDALRSIFPMGKNFAFQIISLFITALSKPEPAINFGYVPLPKKQNFVIMLGLVVMVDTLMYEMWKKLFGYLPTDVTQNNSEGVG